MNILVGCERSGRVRDAFIRKGYNAISCDLEPTEVPGPHYEGGIFDMIYGRAGDLFCHVNWDVGIFFPPCDDIAVSGARWFEEKRIDGSQRKSIEFFLNLWECNIPRIAIENPIGIMSGDRKYLEKWFPDLYERAKKLSIPRIVQPWMFGHPEKKATCLWTRGLFQLKPTNDVRKEMGLLPLNVQQRCHYMAPGPNRAIDRARTYPGIAEAMASQWG